MFSASLDDRFDHGEWVELGSGVPLLQDAAAAFDCVVVQMVEAGTHTIFIGAIVAAVAHGRAEPDLQARVLRGPVSAGPPRSRGQGRSRRVRP